MRIRLLCVVTALPLTLGIFGQATLYGSQSLDAATPAATSQDDSDYYASDDGTAPQSQPVSQRSNTNAYSGNGGDTVQPDGGGGL